LSSVTILVDPVELNMLSSVCVQLYKTLAVQELGNRSLDETNDGERIKQTALLNKAKDALYLTLDRLKGDENHVR